MKVVRARLARLASELRWGFHGVRARGWRAGLIAGMLGVALGASTIIFSAADSFVLGRVPYPNVDRLMLLQRTDRFSGTMDYLSPQALAAWRMHTDVFSRIHAHDRSGSVYLTVGDITEAIWVQEVTPGLFEALGVFPRWGRSLQPGDEAPDRPPVAVVAEDIARRVFGDPALAIGQSLQAGQESLRIVGVMPSVSAFHPHASASGVRSISRAGRRTRACAPSSSVRRPSRPRRRRPRFAIAHRPSRESSASRERTLSRRCPW
jgi:hypothetical protein